jgi:predicted DsbA family dithiol-disulfide isomerase
MTKPLRIDFVSDVSCPWCIIGLNGLEEALRRMGGAVEADIHFQPFELNPDMAPEGQNIVEHIAQKYGSTPAQSAANRQMIRDRAAAVGFRMETSADSRIYNTFDAHRLLHWAELEGRQLALKHALFEAYFTLGRNLGDPEVLAEAAEAAGLDGTVAREILASGRYGPEVRAAERQWQAAGITAVPAVVVNRRYLLVGGQPPEAYQEALSQIAKEAA